MPKSKINKKHLNFKNVKLQVCTRCIYDERVPEIKFNLDSSFTKFQSENIGKENRRKTQKYNGFLIVGINILI